MEWVKTEGKSGCQAFCDARLCKELLTEMTRYPCLSLNLKAQLYELSVVQFANTLVPASGPHNIKVSFGIWWLCIVLLKTVTCITYPFLVQRFLYISNDNSPHPLSFLVKRRFVEDALSRSPLYQKLLTNLPFSKTFPLNNSSNACEDEDEVQAKFVAEQLCHQCKTLHPPNSLAGLLEGDNATIISGVDSVLIDGFWLALPKCVPSPWCKALMLLREKKFDCLG